MDVGVSGSRKLPFGVPTTTHAFSPASYYTDNGTAIATAAGDFTAGSQFIPLRNAKIIGIRFYWGSAGGQTVNCKLWTATDASAVATVSVVTSGVGYYTAYFNVPYTVPNNRINDIFYTTMRDNAGAIYSYGIGTTCKSGVDAIACYSEPGFIFKTASNYAAGDNRPTTVSATERYPVEPIFDMSA